MSIAIKKVGTYTKTDERKIRMLQRLIDENGALYVMRLLWKAMASSNDRHKPVLAGKLYEGIELAEASDQEWSPRIP
jgi:hypothetical protein